MPSMTKRDQQVIDHYEGWEPTEDERSADDVAQDLGITRQRLYQVLNKHNVPLKTGQRGPSAENDRLVAVQEQLVLALQQVIELKEELSEYRAKYGPLL